MNETARWFNSVINEYENDIDFQLEGVLIDINEQIIKLMIEKKMTRKNLADKLGCSKAYITRILQGNQNVTVKTLLQIAKALDVEFSLNYKEKYIQKKRIANLIDYLPNNSLINDETIEAATFGIAG